MGKSSLTRERCVEILEKSEMGYLSMVHEGAPYTIPVNYLYLDDKIYIHTGRKGRKWEALTQNSRVCFNVTLEGRKIYGSSPCSYTYEFESVMLEGKAEKVSDSAEVINVLNQLVDKYKEGEVTPVSEEKMAIIWMIRMDIEKMTGRQNRA